MNKQENLFCPMCAEIDINFKEYGTPYNTNNDDECIFMVKFADNRHMENYLSNNKGFSQEFTHHLITGIDVDWTKNRITYFYNDGIDR